MQSVIGRSAGVLAAAALAGLLAGTASAQTWTAGGGIADTSWGNASNWSAAPLFNGSDALSITLTFTDARRNVVMGGDRDILSLTFGTTTNSASNITSLGSVGQNLTLRQTGTNTQLTILATDNAGANFNNNFVLDAAAGPGAYTANWNINGNASFANSFNGTITQAAGQTWTIRASQSSSRGLYVLNNAANSFANLQINGTTVASAVSGSFGGAAINITSTGGTIATRTTQHWTTPINNVISLSGNGNTDFQTPTRVTSTITQGANAISHLGTSVTRLENADMLAGDTVATTVRTTVAVASMAKLASGTLNLSDASAASTGVAAFVLGSGDVPTWADFAAARTYNQAGGTNTWRLNNAGTLPSTGNAFAAGFAARGSDVVIPASGGGLTSATFARNLLLGSSRTDNTGARYATNAVKIETDITYGTGLVFYNAIGTDAAITRSSSNWTIGTPAIHELAGVLSGTDAIVTFRNEVANNAAAGAIRISNLGNNFSGNSRLLIGINGGNSGNFVGVTSPGGGTYFSTNGLNGGPIAIVPDDAVLTGLAEVSVIAAGIGTSNPVGAMLAFENTGGGTKTFSRNFFVAANSDSSAGFGVWAGSVNYNGTVTLTGSQQGTIVHVRAGSTLSLNGATITNNRTNATSAAGQYNKGGAGTLILGGTSYGGTSVGGYSWRLYEGTLVSNSDTLAQFNSGAALNLSNLLGPTSGSGTYNAALQRTWKVATANHTFTGLAASTFGANSVIDVDPGITLSLTFAASASLTLESVGAGTSGTGTLFKRGQGTLSYTSTTSRSNTVGDRGTWRVEQGTLEITGGAGRTAVELAGGTLLVGGTGNTSNSIGGTGTGDLNGRGFNITPAGGKLGLRAGSDSVGRIGAVTWDQSSASVLQLAARDNSALAFNVAIFPDVAATSTLNINRDGTGTGVVAFLGNTTYNVNGKLGGVGKLQIGLGGTSGLGTLNLNGVLAPGFSAGTLGLDANVVFGGSATSTFELATPGLSPTNDLAQITGDLTLGGLLNIDTTSVAFGGAGTYRLFDYTGTLAGSLGIGSVPGGFTYAIDTTTLGQVNLVVSPAGGPPQWNNAAGGLWSVAGNWIGGEPNAVGAVANFLSVGATSPVNTLFTPVTVGTINFDNAAGYTINGLSPITMQVSSGNAAINAVTGTHWIMLPVTLASDTNISVPAATTFRVDSFNGSGDLNATGAGTIRTNKLDVGSLSIAAGGTVYLNDSGAGAPIEGDVNGLGFNGGNGGTIGAGSTSVITGLSLGAGSTLDIRNNDVVIRNGATDIDTVRLQVNAAYNAGLWDLPGITSSRAAGDGLAVGYGSNADLGYTVFSGVSTGVGDEFFIKYTWFGDANLDGQVDGDDYLLWLAVFGSSGTGIGWGQGDFDYDQDVDGDDYLLWLQNFGNGIGSPLAIPEPGLMGLAAVAGAGLLARRRRSAK